MAADKARRHPECIGKDRFQPERRVSVSSRDVVQTRALSCLGHIIGRGPVSDERLGPFNIGREASPGLREVFKPGFSERRRGLGREF
jgi:hypothetical protein